MAGSHIDLTERKLAEEELRRTCAELALSQERLRQTVEQLTEANRELETTQMQLIQAAKLESVGTLAAGVAHEVKNPLQTILMGVSYFSSSLPAGSEAQASVLNDMRDAVHRANSIIRELLQFSAATKFELKEDDLNAVLERSLGLVNCELVASRITLVRELSASLPPCRFDRGKLEQVFINLFINAIQAMSQGGTLTVRTRAGLPAKDWTLPEPLARAWKAGEPAVMVEIRDTGPGIPEKNLRRVFDPFFTTKPVGVGTGLGLSIVKRIVDLHEGAIDLRNAPGGGVLVTLVLRG
jgi:signal transduction histidine kinase